MTEKDLGRLTLCGGPDVEKAIADIVRRAARVVLRFVPAESLKALVLAGGYGRGEGGIRVDENGERPANNLDFLLFTTGIRSAERAELTALINHELGTVRRRSGMGIDFSIVDARRLERDRVRVLWYDVRYGHKLLAGDPEFLPGLTRFTAEAIDPREMGDLIINRGALLVLNHLILERGPLTPALKEAVLTHVAKAVIGYGDALLFFHGAYHWSYVERRRRMASTSFHTTPEFKSLYDSAMTYRFTGDPQVGKRLLTNAESGHLNRVLSAIHLEVERRRLRGPRMVWHGYVRASLRREVEDVTSSLGKMARGALTLVRGSARLGSGSPYAVRMGLWASGEQGAVRALFPLVAYGRIDNDEVDIARGLLGVKRVRSTAARAAWLHMWGRVFDPNLAFTLKRLGLPTTVAA